MGSPCTAGADGSGARRKGIVSKPALRKQSESTGGWVCVDENTNETRGIRKWQCEGVIRQKCQNAGGDLFFFNFLNNFIYLYIFY